MCGSYDHEKVSNIWPSSQRNLSIFNIEFNNNTKIIARAISKNSRKLGITTKEKFVIEGSASIDQIFTETCYFDYNQSKKNTLLWQVVI